jgi:hypothetical protein
MNKRKFLIFTSLALVLVALSWGIDQGWAQQPAISAPQNQRKTTNYEKLQEELAAKRADQGQMRSTTPSQRKAAAKRLKAALEAQQEQNAPTSGGGVNK